MKIRKRPASEWNKQEDCRRGGCIEFYASDDIRAWGSTPPDSDSTFLYRDEFDALFEEPLSELEKGDWVEAGDSWYLVISKDDLNVYVDHDSFAKAPIGIKHITDVFKTGKPPIKKGERNE